jgi:hypothetical protein
MNKILTLFYSCAFSNRLFSYLALSSYHLPRKPPPSHSLLYLSRSPVRLNRHLFPRTFLPAFNPFPRAFRQQTEPRSLFSRAPRALIASQREEANKHYSYIYAARRPVRYVHYISSSLVRRKWRESYKERGWDSLFGP